MANKTLTAIVLVCLVSALLAVFYQRTHSIKTAVAEEFQEGELAATSEKGLNNADNETVIASRTYFDEEYVRELLRPRELQFFPNGTARNHQLLHLHHMKTGGTSTELLLKCGIRNNNNMIPFHTIHECSRSHYDRCVTGVDTKCLQDIDNAAVMSYCAPMSDLSIFGWDHVEQIDKITVLRHPVDRVWSMFRFQTKSCYGCRTLKQVYASIDNGDREWRSRENCRNQLQNHMTRNMLATRVETQKLNQQSLEEAKEHMQGFILGLTSQLEETVEKVKRVFPFMQGCTLQHANASPQNNHCGPDNTHWDLPSEPDEETKQLIIEHNQLDLALYEAALEQYELQKRILQEMD